MELNSSLTGDTTANEVQRPVFKSRHFPNRYGQKAQDVRDRSVRYSGGTHLSFVTRGSFVSRRQDRAAETRQLTQDFGSAAGINDVLVLVSEEPDVFRPQEQHCNGYPGREINKSCLASLQRSISTNTKATEVETTLRRPQPETSSNSIFTFPYLSPIGGNSENAKFQLSSESD